MRRFHQRSRELLRRELHAGVVGNVGFQSSTILLTAGGALAIGLGGYLFLTGAISLGSVYLIFAYTQVLNRPIEQITRQMQDLQQAGAGLRRIQRLFALRSSLVDGEHHLPIDWHHPYLLFLSVTILLLSVVDAFLTLTLLTVGATEANPVMAFVLSHHPQLFALTKMAFTSIGVLVNSRLLAYGNIDDDSKGFGFTKTGPGTLAIYGANSYGGVTNIQQGIVAAQNSQAFGLADGTAAPGFKSIHFGSPNEYAFEYLMAGGDNSLHVVMGLRKPDARGELSLRPKPYAGKFFMSGAAAGRVYVFDPNLALDPFQYAGNVLSSIPHEEWTGLVAPFISAEARRRGLPLRVDGDHITLRLEGQWRRWRYDEAFSRLVPIQVARQAEEQGVAPPALVQIVGE